MVLGRNSLLFLIVVCFVLIGVLSFGFLENKTSFFTLNNNEEPVNVLVGAEVVNGKYVFENGSVSLLNVPSGSFDSLEIIKMK